MELSFVKADDQIITARQRNDEKRRAARNAADEKMRADLAGIKWDRRTECNAVTRSVRTSDGELVLAPGNLLTVLAWDGAQTDPEFCLVLHSEDQVRPVEWPREWVTMHDTHRRFVGAKKATKPEHEVGEIVEVETKTAGVYVEKEVKPSWDLQRHDKTALCTKCRLVFNTVALNGNGVCVDCR